jgi:putative membrane protein
MATTVEKKAVKAQEKLADSAETLKGTAGTMADSAKTLKGSADTVAESAETLVGSAGTMVGSTLAQESSADRRTKLAADRTLLAGERTYAAWMRTGLAALAAGVGIKALLDKLVTPWLVISASIVLLVFAEFCFVAGVWRELTGKARPEPDAPRLPAWLLVFFNGFMVLLGIAVLVGIVTR